MYNMFHVDCFFFFYIRSRWLELHVIYSFLILFLFSLSYRSYSWIFSSPWAACAQMTLDRQQNYNRYEKNYYYLYRSLCMCVLYAIVTRIYALFVLHWRNETIFRSIINWKQQLPFVGISCGSDQRAERCWPLYDLSHGQCNCVANVALQSTFNESDCECRRWRDTGREKERRRRKEKSTAEEEDWRYKRANNVYNSNITNAYCSTWQINVCLLSVSLYSIC